jgi:hypothetical protein
MVILDRKEPVPRFSRKTSVLKEVVADATETTSDAELDAVMAPTAMSARVVLDKVDLVYTVTGEAKLPPPVDRQYTTAEPAAASKSGVPSPVAVTSCK